MTLPYRIAAVPALLSAALVAARFRRDHHGLFNTGTDTNNVALVGGNGVIDPHYPSSHRPPSLASPDSSGTFHAATRT